jgi:hypothetical protein
MSCEIIMQRCMNENWECDQDTGELEICGLISDGGCSEFSNYYCEEHDLYIDTWEEVEAHRLEVKA